MGIKTIKPSQTTEAINSVMEHMDANSSILTLPFSLKKDGSIEVDEDELSLYLEKQTKNLALAETVTDWASNFDSLNPNKTQLMGKTAAGIGVASSMLDISNDLHKYGVVRDKTLLNASSSLLSLGALACTNPVTGIMFIAASMAISVYALTIDSEDQNVSDLAEKLVENVENTIKEFQLPVISDELGLNYVDYNGNVSISDLWSDIVKDFNNYINPETNKKYTLADGVRNYDPLVIDLDGDGIEAVNIDGGVLFDFDGDGIKTGTGWIGADDGILVYDRNGNGIIDGGGELFGVDTIKADGTYAKDGFDALRELDSNGDGIFDGSDLEFGNVRVWQDLNQDGISQADELKTLEELNIKSISLKDRNANINSNGNRITSTATVEFNDGTTSKAGNIDFVSNGFYREFKDELEVSDEIANLPGMQGSGLVRDLHEAATLNADLASLLKQYAVAETRVEQFELLDSLIEEWAKSSGKGLLFERINNNGIDFRYSWEIESKEPTAKQLAQKTLLEKISILEIFNAREFYSFNLDDKKGTLNINSGSNISITININQRVNELNIQNNETVNDNSENQTITNIIITERDLLINNEQNKLLESAYSKLHESVYQSLLSQTRFKDIYSAIGFEFTENGIELNYDGIYNVLSEKYKNNPVETILSSFELQKLFDNKNISENLSSLRSDWLSNLNDNDFDNLHIAFGNKAYNDLVDRNSIFIGTSSADILDGGSGVNELYGGAGDDVLRVDRWGSYNNIILEGGKGNDTLYGSYYADTYRFNLGDGKDTIVDYGSSSYRDTLEFGEGIQAKDIRLTREGSDLIVMVLIE